MAAADHRCDPGNRRRLRYAPDLAEVARCTGLTTAAVIPTPTPPPDWRAGIPWVRPGFRLPDRRRPGLRNRARRPERRTSGATARTGRPRRRIQRECPSVSSAQRWQIISPFDTVCGMSTDPSRRCSHRACGFQFRAAPELEEAAADNTEILRRTAGPHRRPQPCRMAHLGVGSIRCRRPPLPTRWPQPAGAGGGGPRSK